MDSLCGSGELGSRFWDSNLSLHTDTPDLTPCFQNSLLAWIPCIYLWTTLPCYLFYLRQHHQGYITLSLLSRIKTVLSLLLWCVSWADLFYSFHGLVHGKTPAPIFFVTPLVVGITMLLATLLIQYERLRGVQSSGVLIIFWFLCVLCAIVPFRSKILSALAEGHISEPFRFTTFYIYFALVLLALILSCFREKAPFFSPKNTDPNPCPEKSAGFLSRLSFWWFTEMAILGYRRPLEEQDLWSLNKEDSSQEVVPKLLKAWEQQKQAARHKAAGAPGKMVSGEDEELMGTRARRQQPSFLRALMATFGPSLLLSVVFKLTQDLLNFVNPQLLSVLIRFISDPTAPSWIGYLVAVLMFLCSVIQILVVNQYFHLVFTIALRLRTGLRGIIYRKTLLISNSARREFTVGEMVNLMSVDAQRLMDIVSSLNLLWSAPLQIFLAIYFLWQNLGPSVLAGFALMVLLIPLNGALTIKMRALQVEQMKFRDSRVKLMNEILAGIKVLKFYAWESSFSAKVEQIRKKELRLLHRFNNLQVIVTFLWICAPFMVTLMSLGTYVLVDRNHVLDAEKVFVSLSLFYILKMPLTVLPQMISYLIQSIVSLKRIQNFLSQDELDGQCVERKHISPGFAITIDRGTFTWAQDLSPTLHSVDIQVPTGALVGVVGPVGCGKSSLVSALLGEMEKLEGKVSVKGAVAYVPQLAWIQNSTLQENVLFGRTLDATRYQRALEACALLPDLALLPAGDQTEIGEKGINLSGGQKQRVSLARAVYSDADVFLLDDPLSAVDAHVAKHIFDRVIGPEGLLAKKTRVLVTHSLSFLPQMDLIIVLEAHGQVSEVGSYSTLLQSHGSLANFLRSYVPEEEQQMDSRIEEAEDKEVPLNEDTLSNHTDPTDNQLSGCKAQKPLARQQSALTSDGGQAPGQPSLTHRCPRPPEKVAQPTKAKASGVLIQEEKVETGTVKLSVFVDYAKAMGPWTTLAACVFCAAQNAASIGANVWLSDWTNEAAQGGRQNSTQHSTFVRLGVYTTLGFLQGILVLLVSFTILMGTLQAARSLHQAMLHNKMRSPQSFFDTTPSGRIINRFAKDIQTLDDVLGLTILTLLSTTFNSISIVVVVMASTPLFAVVILPLAGIYFWVQRFYVATSRQLKRLESVSRSPIFSHFSETVTGTSVIRAFGRSQDFVAKSDLKVDTNQRSCYPNYVSNRWLAVRLEFMGNCIVFFSALFAVVGKSSLSPGVVGLSVSYALQVMFSLNLMIRMMSDLDSNIVSVERVKEYSKTEEEAPWVVEGSRPPSDWPLRGEVEFRNYSVRYRPGLDLVLKDLSLQVHSGEKVGIVGRTGAGKSSMTLCLFRILEATKGEILIDGINVADIGLHDLRSRLTIIPQEPILFSGTLRMNLDPFSTYSEEDLWRVLELSHLRDFVVSQPARLDFQCSEGGENLSVGQRQLVCLARALLRKSRILILDEATAAVDLETDRLIQAVIRTQFESCTVLTIAHRLRTIMDYDRVLVLDKGTIAEFDSPSNLIEARGIFYSMARDDGLA